MHRKRREGYASDPVPCGKIVIDVIHMQFVFAIRNGILNVIKYSLESITSLYTFFELITLVTYKTWNVNEESKEHRFVEQRLDRHYPERWACARNGTRKKNNLKEAHLAGCTASASWWLDHTTLTLSGCSPRVVLLVRSFARCWPLRFDFGAETKPARLCNLKRVTARHTRKTRLSPSTFESVGPHCRTLDNNVSRWKLVRGCALLHS